MATWPGITSSTYLPNRVLAEGYSETVPDCALRTNMEVGPAKVRKRTTTNVKAIQCMIEIDTITLVSVINKNQCDILEDFYTVDCGGGATAFTWYHPRDFGTPRTEISMRFTGPPTFSWAGGIMCKATLALEILP